MTKYATRRPVEFRKPTYWSSTPAPAPGPAEKADGSVKDPANDPAKDPDGLSPTRYGDWVKDGIAVDF